MPKMTSASLMNFHTWPLMPWPPEPSDSGCRSLNALLPGSEVLTGAPSSSASSCSSL